MLQHTCKYFIVKRHTYSYIIYDNANLSDTIYKDAFLFRCAVADVSMPASIA